MSVPDARDLHSDLTDAVRGNAAPPESIHEQIARAIFDRVQEMIDASVPKLATVTGQDGGRVRVQLDDEDEPRQVGFARKSGQRYAAGDRVVVMPTRGGDHVVLGSVLTSQGVGEQVVGNADLYDESVDDRTIKQSAVKRKHIDSKAVGTPQIDDSSVGNTQLTNGVNTSLGKADSALQKTDTIPKTQLADNVQNSLGKADSAVQPGQLDNYAKSSDLNSYVQVADWNDKLVQVLSNASLRVDSRGNVTLPRLQRL